MTSISTKKWFLRIKKFNEIQRYLKSITKSSTIPSDIFLVQKTANTDAQKVELFNIYIQSVFTRNANVGKTERQDNVSLNSINFTIDEIEDALSELDVNKASGSDKIGNALLKNHSNQNHFTYCSTWLQIKRYFQ